MYEICKYFPTYISTIPTADLDLHFVSCFFVVNTKPFLPYKPEGSNMVGEFPGSHAEFDGSFSRLNKGPIQNTEHFKQTKNRVHLHKISIYMKNNNIGIRMI